MVIARKGQNVRSESLRRQCAILTAPLLAIVSIGCAPKPGQQAKQVKAPVVVCVEALTRQVTDFDEFVGRTEPSESVDVQARVTGFLQSVEFEDGHLVEKGDLLAIIEPDEYVAINEQALANVELWNSKLALAESSFTRYKELLESQSVSQAEYDESEAAVQEAKSQIAAAKASVARTQLDVEYTKIYAPVSGRADRALVTPGNLVSGGLGSGTLLTRIVNDTPMYVYIDVDERSVLDYMRRSRESGTSNPSGGALKKLGIPCLLKLQDETDFVHEGVLDFAENRVDPNTGTIKIRAVFENEDRFLQGGLFVRVKIPKGEAYQGVLIPEQCIATDQSDRVAYVVGESNEVEMRVLELGGRFGSMRAIRRGIQAGERLVFQGLQKVRPGMKVEPEITQAPAEPTLATKSANSAGSTAGEESSDSAAVEPAAEEPSATSNTEGDIQ